MKFRPIIRPIVQIAVTAGMTWLFLAQDFRSAPQPLFTWTGWIDPLTGIAGFIQGKWLLLIPLSLAFLTLAFWLGRIFCGWLCPIGTWLDLLGLGKRLIKWPDHHCSPRSREVLGRFRWLLLGAVIGLVLVRFSLALSYNPFSVWPREIARIGLGLWPYTLTAITIAGLLVFPRFWCRFICPAGSLFTLMGRWAKRLHVSDHCRRCGICRHACPIQNIDEEFHFGADCLACSLCRASCPVRVVERSTEIATDPGRRDFIVAAGAALGAGLMAGLTPHGEAAGSGSASSSRLLRPPGALAEAELAATCSRCGQCVQVCPNKVVVPAGFEAGLTGLGTPRFIPRRGRCMFCMACGQVCPTSALVAVPVETSRLGSATIDHSRCLVWTQGTDCLLCMETCPTQAIGIDSKRRPVIDLTQCTGCGACEANCPVVNAAVHLSNRGEVRRRR